MIFYNLLLFSKYSVELNKKEKDEIVFKITHNQARDVMWTVSKLGSRICFV
jgi:outer membrane phospholipase A